jgi:hypothetical protein
MKKIFSKLSLATASALASLPLAASSAFATVDLIQTDVKVGDGFATDIGGLLNGVLSFVMVLAALLVFIYLIWGGIEWITSGGDKSKTESARNKITAAIIGLIILAASYALLQLVLRFLGFSGGLNTVLNEVRDIKGN